MYDDRVVRALAAVGLISLALVCAAAPASAAADAGAASAGRVAVLPFAGEGRMALYGQPVAAQVAKVARAAGLEIVLLTAGAAVPADARLVVDGRLVRSGAAIVLEARVRDPERGVDVARRSATAASLAVVDQAADDVASALVPAIRAGLIEQARARARTQAALASTARDEDAARLPARPTGERVAAPIDRRPLVLIALTGALAGPDGQSQTIAPLVAPLLVRLADRIGHRAAPLGEGGLAAPTASVTRGDAALAIVIRVLAVESRGGAGIPQARARARVDVYDRTGLIYRRTVHTDTLVGSRGDRADTMVRSAVAQIVDVVAPRLGEHLAAAAARPAS